MSAEATIATTAQPDSHAFDLWAQVYDTLCNPLLMLEERIATPLLPPLSGADVLDVGCGTGRWLTKLEALNPASLTGTDCSAAMLEHARAKVRSSTRLELGDCSTLPCEEASKSFILASFVLSYIDDLYGFARECAGILRFDGCVLLSDMHPVTAAKRRWTRSFRVDGNKIEIPFRSRSLEEITAAFQSYGFEVQDRFEPSFESPERSIFEVSGKLAEFEELDGAPAIYILKLQKRRSRFRSNTPGKERALHLINARAALGSAAWRDGSILIQEGRIASIDGSAAPSASSLDLSGYALLPGLINAHDHLDFGLFPRLGRPNGALPYRNSPEWGEEIHRTHAAIIERYKQIPKTTRLWWGAIRNLLCGVTTVCHHNPLYPDLTVDNFPVRVISQFGWSHSLAIDPQLAVKFQTAPTDCPFIVHAAEGIDDESRNEIALLDEMRVLDKHTVLIHGLACTEGDISLINARGASLVVCPTSNHFLFAKTLSCNLLNSIERAALGSDSPITAAGDLLDEVRHLYAETGVDPETIYNMVTCNSAEMLHLNDGQGRILEGGLADLIAVRDRRTTPAGTLAELNFADVELVLIAGQVYLASTRLYVRLPHELRSGLELIVVAGHQRWVRATLQPLFDAAENVLGRDKLLIAEKEVRYLGSL